MQNNNGFGGQPSVPYSGSANGNYTTQGAQYGGAYSYTPNQTPAGGMPPVPPEPPKPPKKEKCKRTFGMGAVIICIVLSVVLSASASLAVAYKYLSNNNTTESPSSSIPIVDSSNVSGMSVIVDTSILETTVEDVYEKAAACVVGIRATSVSHGFFGGDNLSEGSGVIYTADGYIITNYHVIETAVTGQGKDSAIEVFLASDPKTPESATVVGYNISADLAVIKIEKTGLPAVELGDSDKIKVGQCAIAIGCPGGLEFMGSVSYGIVSGLNRSITIDSIGEMKLIQTDAAINPGNSGGALLDAEGKLIGINSSKLVDESFEGMGFAIPVNHMKEVVTDIIENKDNPSPYLGIEVYTYDSEYLEKYGFPHGAVIKKVISGGPAYAAGLEVGDIITQFNSVAIEEYTDFFEEFEKCEPGSKVAVRIYRYGRYYTTTVTIGSNNSR